MSFYTWEMATAAAAIWYGDGGVSLTGCHSLLNIALTD